MKKFSNGPAAAEARGEGPQLGDILDGVTKHTKHQKALNASVTALALFEVGKVTYGDVDRSLDDQPECTPELQALNESGRIDGLGEHGAYAIYRGNIVPDVWNGKDYDLYSLVLDVAEDGDDPRDISAVTKMYFEEVLHQPEHVLYKRVSVQGESLYEKFAASGEVYKEARKIELFTYWLEAGLVADFFDLDLGDEVMSFEEFIEYAYENIEVQEIGTC